jgi:Tol biopolymer transport system component
MSLSFSGDGRRIVFGMHVGIVVARPDGRDRSWLMRGGPVPNGALAWVPQTAAFSPDGSQVVFSVGEVFSDPTTWDGERVDVNVYVIGVDGADLRLIARDAGGPVFSPDGKRIAYIAFRGGRQAIETVATDGTDRRTLVAETDSMRVDFSPDGTRLMLLERFSGERVGGRIVIADAQSGERTRLPARITGAVVDAVWSPDGRRFAFVNHHSNKVFTIRPDGTGKRLAFTARVGEIDSLAWQPRP